MVSALRISELRILRVMLAVACVTSAVAIFRPVVPQLGAFGISLSVINTVIFGGAFYGIQKRAMLMWRLGFFVIVGLGGQFLMQSLILTRSIIGRTQNPEMLAGFLMLMTLAVTAYWLFWWKRQKPFFISSSTDC